MQVNEKHSWEVLRDYLARDDRRGLWLDERKLLG